MELKAVVDWKTSLIAIKTEGERNLKADPGSLKWFIVSFMLYTLFSNKQHKGRDASETRQ